MKNLLLFITTCLGLCVSISAIYEQDCDSLYVSKEDHPRSKCVKVERCPKLLQYYKKKFNGRRAEALMRDVLCHANHQQTCCPISWIEEDIGTTDGSCGKEIEISSRIVGGHNARHGNFPWMAAIGYIGNVKEKWICGGSIISKHHILTAAHCLYKKIKELIFVRLGDINLDENVNGGIRSKDFQVEKIAIHPAYSHAYLTRDIAMLRIEGNLIFNANIQPICLPPPGGFSVVGKEVTVAGWGHIKYDGPASTDLRFVKLQVLDSSACVEVFDRGSNRIDRYEIVCSGFPAGGRDSCQGDSGGPLMYKYGGVNYVIGIVSYGDGCGRKDTPAIYTDVSGFLNWIELQMEL